MRLALVCLFVLPLSTFAEEEIIPKGSKLELLFTRSAPIKGGLTEGPACAPDGSIYFSDIPVGKDKGMILRFDPKTKRTTVFTNDSHKSNGLKFDAKGNLIACEGSDEGGRAVVSWDIKTKKRTVLADRYKGKRFNAPNDLVLDTKGRIYFSDPRYLGYEAIDQPFQAVYRVDPDRSIHRIITDAGKPNGVCVSPDQRTLYVVSNDNGTTGIGRVPDSAPVAKGRMALLAYDLAADGTAKFRKLLADYSPEDGPDGLTADAEGNLYVAVRRISRPGIVVYSPDGKERAFIRTPNLPTNVGFGRGADANMLYITEGGNVHRMRVKKAGYQLPAQR